MAKRKTVDVEPLLEQANRLLALKGGSREFRLGVAAMIENVLLAANRYQGYSHLSKDQVPEGELPGVIYRNDGIEFPDNSRRYYYS